MTWDRKQEVGHWQEERGFWEIETKKSLMERHWRRDLKETLQGGTEEEAGWDWEIANHVEDIE